MARKSLADQIKDAVTPTVVSSPLPPPADNEPIIYSLHRHLFGRTSGSRYGDVIVDQYGFIVNFYTLRAKMATAPVTAEEFLATVSGFADAKSYNPELVQLWDATREERDKARAMRDMVVRTKAPAIVPNSAPGRTVYIDPVTGKVQDPEFVGRIQDLTGVGLPSQTSPDPATLRKPAALTDDGHEPLILSGVATERAKQKLEEQNRLAQLVAQGTAAPSGPEPVVTASASTAPVSAVSIEQRQMQVVKDLVEREPDKLGVDGMPKINLVHGALVRASLPPISMDQVKDIMAQINAGTI